MSLQLMPPTLGRTGAASALGALIATCFAWLLLPSLTNCATYSRETAVVQAVRKVSPAVVNISSQYEVRRRSNPFSGFGIDPFFDSFFNDFFDRGQEQRIKRQSLGSGVIIDGKRGFILTNAHVIAKTGKITAVLRDEREFEAAIVGADPDSDLAVLRLDAKEALPAIEMGRSDDLMIGETVIAIGNPFGFSNTVTTGVISAVQRSVRTEDRIYHDFIQIDASINPGNSGGPLLNINGELIGINTAIYAKGQGIGFAIPINIAKRIISDLIRHGEVIPAWLGLTVQELDENLAGYLKVPGKGGVLVKAVHPKGPAAQPGIKAGDIILSLGSKRIHSASDYHLALKKYASGDPIPIEIWRNDKKETVTVVARIFPEDLAFDLAQKLFGITVTDISRKNRRAFNLQTNEGVVITDLKRGSSLARIGVRPGDVIRQMDEMQIQNTDDFKKAVVKSRRKRSVVILVQRGEQGYYITVKL